MKKELLACSVFAIASGQFAMAQDTNEEAATTASRVLSTVQVTSTKKANPEDVQDIPIAVTAFGAEQLDALNLKDLTSIDGLVPNASIRPIGTFKGVAAISIRGQGTLNSILSIDPSVGIISDGIYLGINQAALFDNFDIESIEVLRGPQGILFGRNVIGGAMVVNTTRPTDELEVELFGDVNSGFRGTGVDYTVSGRVSGPITDTLKGKLAVYHNNDDGWFKNSFDGENYAESETTIYRGALEWDPTENLNFLVRYEHGEMDAGGVAAQSHLNAAGNPGQGFDRDTFDHNQNNPGSQRAEWDFATFETNIDVDFGDGVVTNIMGYRQVDFGVCLDIDASPLDLFNSSCLEDPVGSGARTVPDGGSTQDQFSNELRYAGTFGPVDIQTGLYYFDQEQLSSENRSIFGGLARQSGGGIQNHTVRGVFFNADYHVNDKLSLQAGARYTEEEKDARVTSLTAPKPNATLAGFCTVAAGTCPFDQVGADEWSNVDYKIGASYDFADNLMGYAHFSTGFRSGGFNLRNSSPTDSAGPFDEETVENWEVGFKSEPNDQLRVNGALFFTTAEDLQRAVITPGASTPVQRTANTADSETLGAEIEVQYSPVQDLLFIGTLGYLDAEYTEILFDLTGDGVVDGIDLGLDLPNAPEITSSFSAIYDYAIADAGVVSSRLTYTHRDTNFDAPNAAIIPSQDLLNFNITYKPNDANWDVSLYGRNVTNDVIFTSDTQLSSAIGGGTYATMAKGRQIGIQATWRNQ